ncbi:hypothetical protein [Paraburkholderia dilworthii]|uniref:Uncharacterized protein n=1 Tax=Paraburkholderia dilworthii TaxID=948106 RepID=A0ABW9D517_9BURK
MLSDQYETDELQPNEGARADFICPTHSSAQHEQHMKKNLKFRIGATWLCIENRDESAPEYPDSVSVVLRQSQSNGQPGRRIEMTPRVQRNAILALGLRLLDLAGRMTPETTSSDSQSTPGNEPSPSLLDEFDATEVELVESLPHEEPVEFARDVSQSAKRLRKRMPILRAAQSVLEQCNDETATRLYLTLVAADMDGSLPSVRVPIVAESSWSPCFEQCVRTPDTTEH